VSSEITILPGNRIIIRTPTVWYMVSLQYVKEQRKVSKNQIFERAYQMAKEKYGDEYE